MNNNVETIKEYLASGIQRIKKVIPNDDYTLTLIFDNNEVKSYDMSDKLFGVFKILRDVKKFKEVFIDECGNIAWEKDKNVDSKKVWNNIIDICKDSIYLSSVPLECTEIKKREL